MTGYPSRTLLYGAWLVVAFLLLSTLGANAAEPKRVLLLHSFGRDFAPFSEMTKSFQAALVKRSPEPVDIYEASIFTARFREPENEGSLVKYLQDLFSGRRLDLIVAQGGPAAAFVEKYRQQLFFDTPIVIAGVDARLTPDAATTPNATYIGVKLDLPAFVENILRVRPETTDIAVVIGNSPNEQFWARELHREFQPFADRVEFEWLDELSLDEMLRRVARLPPQSAVLYFMLAVDGAGAVHPLDAAFTRIREVATVPVFGYGDYHLGQGSVGGPADQTRALGQQTADVALRILAGERASDIKTPLFGLGIPAYDWRELQRWGISEAILPPNSEVRFRSPSVWDLYRWYIVGTISLIVLQTLLIVSFLVQRTRRRAAEIGIRAKESELRVSYDQVRRLAGRLIYAQEEERTRIARELHDDVGQRVASLSIGLSSLRRRVPNPDDTARSELSGLQQQVVGLAKDLRDLSHELHPGALEHVGLLEALRGRCEEINGESGTRVDVEVAGGWSEVADDVELCLYRVAQEALRNITKHAHARTARISLARGNSHVVMRITDDGGGFQENGSNGLHGIGLLSMRERVRMLEGTFEMASSSRGTVATVVIPTGERH
ncbi:histidine kinase [Mesorhizobium sp. YC-2]|uniref:sensor histidine kinase n=1 Tax=Mesorhizobium sp. YC-2 TaxID=2986064 RepID=UPI0021E83005|nr:histidine kinase [Mesorhizobium sp. YC-2]MCV3211231.1 histidine kinase [Mesorhizobium sp. YC-2]